MRDGPARRMEGCGRLCGEDDVGGGDGDGGQHGGLAGLHGVRVDEREEVVWVGDPLRCLHCWVGGRFDSGKSASVRYPTALVTIFINKILFVHNGDC